MTIHRRFAALAVAAACCLAASGPALAHHPMGGVLPSTWWHGLLSGFGHPLIGPDHLAFLLAAALLTVGRPRPHLILGALVLASLTGVFLHVGLVTLPAVEPVIATSVLLAGIGLLALRPLGTVPFTVLLLAAGLFHGYAFGESIVGAEQTPLVAYLCGLAVVQFAVAWGIMSLARLARLPAARPLVYRGIGAVVAIGGVVLLGQAIA
jgi:urease accessory protein